jgi:hypothetical protein
MQDIGEHETENNQKPHCRLEEPIPIAVESRGADAHVADKDSKNGSVL